MLDVLMRTLFRLGGRRPAPRITLPPLVGSAFLRGVNLGGYLMCEGWIWGGGTNSETTTRTKISDLVGPVKMRQFWRDTRTAFIRAEDMALIKSLGYDHVRLPFNHRLLTAYTDEDGIAVIGRVLDLAQAQGLKVVLDLHGAPGGATSSSITGNVTSDAVSGEPNLWASASNRTQTVAVWTQVATAFKDHPALLWYDVLNEPWDSYGNRLVALYQDIVTAIRAVDTATPIVLEGNLTGKAMTWRDYTPGRPNPIRSLAEVTDPSDKLIWSAHQYEVDLLGPLRFFLSSTDPAVLMGTHISAAATVGRKMWIGEHGQTPQATVTAEQDRYRAQGALGACHWTYKLASRNRIPFNVTGNSAWAPVKWTPSTEWQAVMDYACGREDTPPSETTAELGLESFLEDVQDCVPAV